jgi:hypothetical protein
MWLARSSDASRQQKGYLLLLLSIACAALLYGDSQLSTTGVACAVLAALLLGLARRLSTIGIASRIHTLHFVDTLLSSACVVVILSLGMLWKEWEALSAVANLPGSYVARLLANVTFSAVTTTIGGSLLIPIGWCQKKGPVIAPILALVGFTGCLSTMLLPHYYTSIIQLSSYGTAILAISRLYSLGEASEQFDLCCLPTPIVTPGPTIHTNTIEPGLEARESLPHSLLHLRRTLFLHRESACRYVGAGMMGVAWILFLSISFAPRALDKAPTSLDRAFQPTVAIEVVVSMYKEPVDRVASLVASLQRIPALASARMHIYTKDATVNISAIQRRIGAHQVTLLPNIGREGQTYLHHILSQWDHLAKHTLFVQAEPHNQAEFLWRLQTYFNPSHTGMLDLGFRGHSFRCKGGGSDRWGWRDPADLVSRVYNDIYHSQCCSVLLSYKGQFVVSANRIRGIGKHIYYDLHQALVNPRGWAHQGWFLQGQEDTMSAPTLGYTIERLWSILFQCSDVATVRHCPSFISGKIGAVHRGSCQCLDT